LAYEGWGAGQQTEDQPKEPIATYQDTSMPSPSSTQPILLYEVVGKQCNVTFAAKELQNGWRPSRLRQNG